MPGRGARGWTLAVAVSAMVVVLVALALGIGWISTNRTSVTEYASGAPVRQVDLRLASGAVTVVGGSSETVQVRRTDSYSFGHAALEQRSLIGGVLSISSRCPRIVLGSCSASYELSVPETVAVNVRTGDGDIRLSDFRGAATLLSTSGSVEIGAYCGFDLSAASSSGSVHVAAACSPRRLVLRSTTGDTTALVPPGRYRINATGAVGKERVSGVVRDEQAPFTIDAHSGTGAVSVEGGL